MNTTRTITSYIVFDWNRNLWLQDDEREWGPFGGRAIFTSHELARDVAMSQTGGDMDFIYILAEIEGPL